MLVLQNVTIRTPSCAALASYQAMLCGSAPSPHFIVTPGFLWLSHWSTSALEARNVTVTCSGPVGLHPCVSVVATSGQDVVNALALLQPPTSPAAAMFVYVANDVTLAGSLLPRCGVPVEAPASSIPAAAFSLPPANGDGGDGGAGCAPVPIRSASRRPIPFTLRRLVVSGGAVLPPRVAAAALAADSGHPTVTDEGADGVPGMGMARAPVLDLGGASALLDVPLDTIIRDGARVAIHNLTLAGLPLGAPSSYPLGLVRALLGFLQLGLSAFFTIYPDGQPLLAAVSGVEMLLEPHEVSMWAASVSEFQSSLRSTGSGLGDASPTPAPLPLAAAAQGPPAACARLGGRHLLLRNSLFVAMEGRPAAGAPAAFLLTNVTGNIAYSYVLLTPSVPEVKTNACDFPLLPGCDVGGGSAEAANTSAPLAAPAAALPYLCRLRPEGAAAEATPLEYAFRAGRITDSIYPLDVGDLE
ncbi:hypothetical protein GPECTOR_9g635 [Gonium pectorale]|uniref:Uncharacterized protein n=1 Tax=Gonium pectorale TaxID=33097 RepID=A0A150GTC1_GONPE|nr:hypothetical protein GPECTOR_9g635 [Gonium pectorale]|eukprot:KXZ52590.1 hypothetical protein GPECTOR_9g635 [Gonium pectorale]